MSNDRALADPFFSVIVPTYNRAHLLKETIESVISQEYQSFELIVVDDGSTDNTAEIMDQFINDKVHYFIKENGERGAARNYGVTKSKGVYVTFLDSDDKIYPNHLKVAREFTTENNNPPVFHQAYEIKTQEGEIIRRIRHSGHLNEKLLTGNDLSCLGVFIRQEIARTNPFREERVLAGSEDWELWVRLASQYKFLYTNQLTSCLISHAGRGELNQEKEKLIERIEFARQCVISDPKVIERFPGKDGLVSAHLYLFIALHLALLRDRSLSMRYIFKAIFNYPLILFNKKIWVVLVKWMSN